MCAFINILCSQTGMLTFGPKDSAELKEKLENLVKQGQSYEFFSASEVRSLSHNDQFTMMYTNIIVMHTTSQHPHWMHMITILLFVQIKHQIYDLYYSLWNLQANRRYPHQLNLPLHYQCVLDEDGGVLLASKCLAAFQASIIIIVCNRNLSVRIPLK